MLVSAVLTFRLKICLLKLWAEIAKKNHEGVVVGGSLGTKEGSRGQAWWLNISMGVEIM